MNMYVRQDSILGATTEHLNENYANARATRNKDRLQLAITLCSLLLATAFLCMRHSHCHSFRTQKQKQTTFTALRENYFASERQVRSATLQSVLFPTAILCMGPTELAIMAIILRLPVTTSSCRLLQDGSVALKSVSLITVRRCLAIDGQEVQMGPLRLP